MTLLGVARASYPGLPFNPLLHLLHRRARLAGAVAEAGPGLGGLRRRQRLHGRVLRREGAGGIDGAGFSGQREGLAAAAAPVDLAALAGATGLRPPVGAAVGLEGRRLQPDLAQALVAAAGEGAIGRAARRDRVGQ